MSEWKKNCPKCGGEQIYTRRSFLLHSIRENKQCRKCMFNSDEYKNKHKLNSIKMWQDNREGIITKRNTDEAKEKWRKSAIPSFNTKKYKKLQNKIHLEYLQKHPEKVENNKKSIKKIWDDKSSVYHTNEFREKLSEKVKIAIHKPDIRKRHVKALAETKYLGKPVDRGQIEMLNKWNKLGFNFQPNYQIYTDTDLFYVDGYDKEKNVVLEYDSKYHLRSKQRERDLVRQNKIINILKPKKFWRYDAINKKFNNVLERNS